MMNATIALQRALVARLAESDQLTGVYHDPPARAHFPYAVLHCSDEQDWSCIERQGRQITLQLVLWDEQPSRLLITESQVEDQLVALQAGPGWHLSTLVLTGKRRSRDPGGPWSCNFELRARMIEAHDGGSA